LLADETVEVEGGVLGDIVSFITKISRSKWIGFSDFTYEIFPITIEEKSLNAKI
jgi:hypothetical protein